MMSRRVYFACAVLLSLFWLVFFGCAEKVNIFFDSAGGVPVASISANKGDNVDLTDKIAQKEGFTFLGWRDSENNQILTKLENVQRDYHLVAEWQVNGYNIVFDTLGGTQVATMSVDKGVSVDLSGKITQKEGHTFLGWKSDDNQIITKIENIQKNYHLVAEWQVNEYTVTFNTNNLVVIDNQLVKFNDLITVPEFTPLVDFPLEGWFSDDQFTLPWNFAVDVMPSKDLTLYAKMLGVPKVKSHYYDKGTLDYTFTDYDFAFSDNHTDSNVEVSAWIVVEFTRDVDPATVTTESFIVKRENPPYPDSAENNNNIISGEISFSATNKTVYFKPHCKFYLPENSSFIKTTILPNYNTLKPGWTYNLTLSAAIKSPSGLSLNTDGSHTWKFSTSKLDYGIYLFKDGEYAQKYVSGREYPSEYFDKDKNTLIFSHGWQSGTVKFDYYRQAFLHNPSKYVAATTVDLVSFWKSKGWNFGAYYWNQFADEDEIKPVIAEKKIWQKGNGKIKICTGKGTLKQETLTYNYLSVSEALGSMCGSLLVNKKSDSEFRMAGHSLGNQVAHGATYWLFKNKRALTPNRLTLLDPYWADPAIMDAGYWNEHIAGELKDQAVANRNTDAAIDSNGLVYGNKRSGPVAYVSEICRTIEDTIIAEIPNFAIEYYDGSQVCDGDLVIMLSGDRNIESRDIAVTCYITTPWIDPKENLAEIAAKSADKHNNTFYLYFWQMDFPAPSIGFSATTPTETIISLMNKRFAFADRKRFVLTGGKDSPTPQDDTYTVSSSRAEWSAIPKRYFSPSWQQ